MIAAIEQLPSLKKAQKQAFGVAKTITELDSVMVYPVTEFIGAIYNADDKSPDLRFPKALRKLYENDVKRFIAFYNDGERVFAFIRNDSDSESFVFEESEALAGIISVLTNFYQKSYEIYFVKSDADEIDEKSRDLVETAVSLVNEQRDESEKIDPGIVKFGRAIPEGEDFQMLVREQNLYSIIREKLLAAARDLAKKKKEEISVSKEEKGKGGGERAFSPTTAILLAILAGVGYYYYSENFSKRENPAPKGVSFVQLKAENAKKNAFVKETIAKAVSDESFSMAILGKGSIIVYYKGAPKSEKSRPFLEFSGGSGFKIEAYSHPIRKSRTPLKKTESNPCFLNFKEGDSVVFTCFDAMQEEAGLGSVLSDSSKRPGYLYIHKGDDGRFTNIVRLLPLSKTRTSPRKGGFLENPKPNAGEIDRGTISKA